MPDRSKELAPGQLAHWEGKVAAMTEDWKQHLADVTAKHPEWDRQQIFECWMIQQLAGHEIVLRELAARAAV